MNKYRIKKRKRVTKTTYILVAIFLMSTIMAIGYSIFSTSLLINNKVILTPQQAFIISPQGTDANGIERFTVNSTVNNLYNNQLLKVTKEELNKNSLTTTMQVIPNLAIYRKTLQIKIEIQNGLGTTFTNGKIECIEYSDSRPAITEMNQSLGKVTLEPGETTTVNIDARLYVQRIESQVNYKFKISFNTESGLKEFYYTLILLP